MIRDKSAPNSDCTSAIPSLLVLLSVSAAVLSTSWLANRFPLIAMGLFLLNAVICVAGLSARNPLATRLAIAGALSVNVFCSYLQQVPVDRYETRPRTDNEMIGELARDALLAGMNPYNLDYSDYRTVFRDDGLWTTHHIDGSQQQRLTYPAFPTLLYAALKLVGLSDIRLFIALSQIALLTTLCLAVRHLSLLFILLPLLSYLNSALGTQDPFWAMLLALAVVFWERPNARAWLYAIAANFRQQPILLGPLFLVKIAKESKSREEAIREGLRFFIPSALLFTVCNAPFAASNFENWFASSFEPAIAQFDVFSVGFSTLVQSGVLPRTPSFFSVLQWGIYVSGLIYALRARAIGAWLFLIPMTAFLFYYRALPNYIIYWLPAFALALERPERWGQLPNFGTQFFKNASLAALTLIFIAMVATKSPKSSLEVVSLKLLKERSYGDVLTELEITLRNNGATALTPVLGVQQNLGMAPWRDSTGRGEGLGSIPAGATRTLRFSTHLIGKAPKEGVAAQIVINSQERGYQDRTVYSIEEKSVISELPLTQKGSTLTLDSTN